MVVDYSSMSCMYSDSTWMAADITPIRSMSKLLCLEPRLPVSYTHLTLPTILRV